MSTEQDTPLDLKPLEAELAALSPSAVSLGRDELMYRAGWEACAAATVAGQTEVARSPVATRRRVDSIWWASTAALVVLSATLGFRLATRAPEVRVVHESQPSTSSDKKSIAQSKAPTPTQSDSPPRSDNDYLSLRDRVLALGPDVLFISAAEPVDRHESPQDLRYGALRGALRGG